MRTKLTAVAALAVAAITLTAVASANTSGAINAGRAAAAVPSCRAGNAPLPGGASTNPKSGAGLVARGWDSWSYAGEPACGAGSAKAKQRVAIQVTSDGGGFVLIPLTSGALKSDTGTVAFCCWTQRTIMRHGESIDINNPRMTLTGKLGTLVARNKIGWIDVPDGLSVFTGSWKVVRGTGAYAGLAGGGRGAGVTLSDGTTKAQFQGFLHSK